MIKTFICDDGTVFAFSTGYDASVDEVIEFLEAYRGKRFWNGAAGDVTFRLDGETICCDSKDFQYEQAYEKSEEIEELLVDFMDSDEESTTESEWRARMEAEAEDEDDE